MHLMLVYSAKKRKRMRTKIYLLFLLLFVYIVTMTFKHVNKHDLNRQDQHDKSDKLVEEVWQRKQFPNTTSRVLINYKLSEELGE